MTDQKPTYIISDKPEFQAKEFNFEAYSKTIADLIANKPDTAGLRRLWRLGIGQDHLDGNRAASAGRQSL